MSTTPPMSERPNVRKNSNGKIVVDLKDSLSAEQELERLDKVMQIVKEADSLEQAKETVNEEFSGGSQ